jgi:(S)-mandelate dehydrogenase
MTDAAVAQPATAAREAKHGDSRSDLMRYFPTAFDLRKRARKRMPNFAFEYGDGGAGQDGNIKRNWDALDAVELMPRYGKVIAPPSAQTTIMGRSYSAPIGIAPVGGPGTCFPGAERFLAAAAQAARVPYTLGVMSGITIEEAARIAPDVLWFQLYRFSKNDHRIGLDLVRRCAEANVQALVLTFDTPTRTTRPRETKSGIPHPFRLTMKMRLDALSSPPWMMALAKNGIPRFVSFKQYMGGITDLTEQAAWIRREQGGAFTWDELSLYRDKWKGKLVLKGLLHPADAERAVKLGIDALQVSNHGGRQIEALPATIDALPEIVRTVGGKATIILDSGVRSGVDAARAVALGADAAFAGKAFLWSLGALGEAGPAHMIELLTDDVRATLGQTGCLSVAELRKVPVRHPGAWKAGDWAERG